MLNSKYVLVLAGFTINEKNIQLEISNKFNNIVDGITRDLSRKLVFLKIDCVTRFNRSIIGINCQFISDGKIKIMTLGMAELLDRHTGHYLKQEVSYTLNKYK